MVLAKMTRDVFGTSSPIPAVSFRRDEHEKGPLGSDPVFGFRTPFEHALVVSLLVKEQLSAIAPGHYMIDRPGVLNAKRPYHASSLSLRRKPANIPKTENRV